MTININAFPVMQKQCATCPFLTDSKGRYPEPMLVNRIQQQCLTQASQICHHPRLTGKPETHLCRGARDYQIEIFYRLGILEASTDDAWGAIAQKAISALSNSLITLYFTSLFSLGITSYIHAIAEHLICN